jgi:hypothetical protein
VLGHNARYSFSLYDARGNVQRTIGRQYLPVPVSEEEKKTQLKILQQSSSKQVPSHHPAYQGITIDPKGRIIVQTWEKPERGGGRYYDVFDVTGKFTARIVLKFPPRLWHKDKLYSIEEDDVGLPQVVRYTVVWKI